MSQLPCPANERGYDQRDGKWNEKPDVAIAVRPKIIYRVNFVQHEIPHRHVQHLEKFVTVAPHAQRQCKRGDEQRAREPSEQSDHIACAQQLQRGSASRQYRDDEPCQPLRGELSY